MNPKAFMDDAPTLETERLILRPLSPDDADALHRISNEPNVRLYLWDDEPVSEATIKGLIARSARTFSKENLGLFGVRIRGNEDLLGFCGFVRLGGVEEPELSYALTQKVWGKGLATEASRTCLRHAFEEAGLERVIACADAPNAASQRVMEKLGMKRLGDINPGAPGEPYDALYRENFFGTATAG